MSYLFTALRETYRAISYQIATFWGSVLTVFLAMLVAGSFALIIKNTNVALEKLKDEAMVEVYLENEIDSLATEQLKDQIVANKYVLSVKFISKDAALYRLRQTFGADMVAGLKTNPLPESFEISLSPEVYDENNFTSLVDYLANLPGVEDIGYVPTVIDRLKTLFKVLTILGVIMGLLVALATAFIVSNTIQVKISDRRQTFYIMRLVGAGSAFIRFPYILIGTLIGFLGTCLAIILVKLAQVYFTGFVIQVGFLTTIETICFIIAGGLFGLIGSHLALKKFLKL